MNSVKIDRITLLKIVRDNRDKHIKDHMTAIKAWLTDVEETAKENLELAKTHDANKIAKMKSTPLKPESYVDTYDRAIRMLELSVDLEITLTSTDFNQIVMDEWSWKQSFALSNAKYLTK